MPLDFHYNIILVEVLYFIVLLAVYDRSAERSQKQQQRPAEQHSAAAGRAAARNVSSS